MSAAAANLVPPGSPGHVVLIVDDNPTNLGVLVDYLNGCGLKTPIASSGELALKRARYIRPDLILLDVMMPGMDGFETCRQLKADEQTRHIPVIFMTALASPDDKVKGFEAGAVDYVTKPLHQEEVMARVAIHLRIQDLTRAEKERRLFAESLEETGRLLSSSLDMHEVPDRILERLATVVPYERGAVLLKESDTTRIVAQRGFPTDQPAVGLCIPIREGDVFQRIAEDGRPLVLDAVTQTPVWQQVGWLPVHQSWLGVPLISKERVIGMMSLTRQAAGAFAPQDAVLASAFAVQAAIALENARLYDEIKCFNERLEHMVQQRTEELNQAYRTLQQLDKTKSTFIEVAAHELRTPLTLIKGYAQLLEPIAQQDHETKVLVDGIVSGETRLHEIVNSLLDMTRLTSHSIDMHVGPTSLGEVIGGVCRSFEAALKKRRLTLGVAGMEDLPIIRADPELLSKVFYHLVVNAIKYTPNGGAITITGRVIGHPLPPTQLPSAAVEIVVSDTGIGIDPAHHELIFEKFYQTGEVALHSSGKTKFKGGGPGLGLAIARGIVQAHGGRLWVESEGYDEQKCPGSHFHVCLLVNNPPS